MSGRPPAVEPLTLEQVRQALHRAETAQTPETFRWTTATVEQLRQLEIADRTRQVRGWRRPVRLRSHR